MLKRLKDQGEHHFDRMFDTRSEAWEKVGLAMQTSQRAVKRAQREAAVLLPLLVGVLDRLRRAQLALRHDKVADATWPPYRALDPLLQIVTVIACSSLGWAIARDIGKAAAPTFFRRMDPATAGTVGFVIRLATLGVTLLLAF